MAPDDELVEVVPIQAPEGMENFFDVGEPAVSPPPQQPGQQPSSPPVGSPPSTAGSEGTAPPAQETTSPGQAGGEPPATQASPTPVPAAQLPEWFAEIPEAERGNVLASALAAMSPQQRAQLGPVQELLGAAQSMAAAAVQNQTWQQQQEQFQQNLLLQGTNEFINNLSQWAPADVNLRQHADQLVQVAQRSYHEDITGRIEQGLLRGLARVGLGPNNLPPTLLARVNSAPDYGSVVQAYLDATADAAFELGKVKNRSDSSESLKAEATAAKARAKNEALGELAKEGRIRLQQDGDGFLAQLLDSTPPSLSGTPAASGPGEIDEAEFNEAMRDPEAYERLMKDPVKAEALHKLMAGALAT